MAKKRSKLPESARLQYQTSQPAQRESAPAAPIKEQVALDASTHDHASFAEAFVRGQKPQKLYEVAHKVSPKTPVAIIVCHGMGEQVRYETLGDLAEVLLRTADPSKIKTTVTLSRPAASFIERAEITWTETSDDSPPVDYNVHLYEAYWAPITEGGITYYETLKFLFSAGWRGVTCSRFFHSNYFKRWMFGKAVCCEIKTSTGWSLLTMLVVLCLIVALIFALGLQLASQLKLLSGGHLRLSDIIHFFFPFYSGRFQNLWGILISLGFWALAFVSYKLKDFIVQYAGDVAAYISPYKASKFQKIRDSIQQVGFDVASLVYGFTSAEIPRYEKVIVVGHSLGSVLAYDTLNAMLNLDHTRPAEQSMDVIGRTYSLVTFGSPLNKTAFLFRNQTNNPKDPLREQMSAANQPLIVDYAARSAHFRWTNIFSPMDIISGCLSYYDDKDDPAYSTKKIVNLRDPQASTPLLAHVQYWENDLLTDVLLEEIRRPPKTAPPQPAAQSAC